jgi:hypothetical protein
MRCDSQSFLCVTNYGARSCRSTAASGRRHLTSETREHRLWCVSTQPTLRQGRNRMIKRYRTVFAIGMSICCMLSCHVARAQFRISPQDSIRLVKEAKAREDSLRRVEAQAQPLPTAGDTLPARGATAKKDSLAAPKPATPSNVRTIERQTAPHAGKNLPHVKDPNPKTR